ncbi:MAG: right-handed parallel beta-helix repeat-containing protein [Candidatus Bathyarchaeota archaeon]|nr:right-handed parallel beta-helix repeat-containing protein [Candidatus Bathyarchaeota archaeon]
MRKTLSAAFVILLFTSTFMAAAVNSADAEGTLIHIMPDGTVKPATAPIQRSGDSYVFTGNIQGSIIIERDNVVLEGAGFTLQGTGADDYRPSEEPLNVEELGKGTAAEPPDPNKPYVTPESNNTGIYSNAENLTIRNLKITKFWCAIELEYSSDNCIIDNKITTNTQGIWIHYSSNNTITGNDVSNNKQGITLLASHDNVYENTIKGNEDYGIKLQWSFNNISANHIAENRHGVNIDGSSHNIFRNNSFAENILAFTISDWKFPEYIQDLDDSNFADGKPMYYWTGKQDMAVPEDAGWVALVNCTNVTVTDLDLTSQQQILLVETTGSNITGNVIAQTEGAIYLERSSDNLIADNAIAENSWGIQLVDSYNNIVSRNNLTETYEGVLLDSSWNNTIEENKVTKSEIGFKIRASSFNVASRNNLEANGIGIQFSGKTSTDMYLQKAEVYASSNNTFFDNCLAENNCSIYIAESSDNTFFHNSFFDNTIQVTVEPPLANVTAVNGVEQDKTEFVFINCWDNGTEGNYWSNYQNRYPDAKELNESGVWDTTYIIDEYNFDNCPLVNSRTLGPIDPFPAVWITAAALTLIVIAVALHCANVKRPFEENWL